MMNYWKPCGNISREKDKLIITPSEKQLKAQGGFYHTLHNAHLELLK